MVSLIKKYAANSSVRQVLRAVRPWVTALVVFLVLRYTGALSGIATFTNSALLYSGLLNASTEEISPATRFDYNFTVKDLQGNLIPVDSFKGKAIFLNIWATWCGPCRAEMPSIQSLYEKVDKNKVVFLMLATDQRETDQKVKKFINNQSFTFPVYRPHGELPELLMVPSIPTTLVVNAEGKVVSMKSGAANYDTSKFLKFLEKQSSFN